MSVSRAVSLFRALFFDIPIGLPCSSHESNASTIAAQADLQPSVAPSTEQRNMLLDQEESDGENEIGEDELLDEDDMVGSSVSIDSLYSSEVVGGTDYVQHKTTPSAKRRADQALAKKTANAERKANISEIGKKRTAVEEKKVCSPHRP